MQTQKDKGKYIQTRTDTYRHNQTDRYMQTQTNTRRHIQAKTYACRHRQTSRMQTDNKEDSPTGEAIA